MGISTCATCNLLCTLQKQPNMMLTTSKSMSIPVSLHSKRMLVCSVVLKSVCHHRYTEDSCPLSLVVCWHQQWVWLFCQGEMSATVFYFPGSYVKLLPVLRRRLAAGSVSSSNIKLGVSTNFDKLCGCVLQVSLLAAQHLFVVSINLQHPISANTL